jgi:hypothetical protein
VPEGRIRLVNLVEREVVGDEAFRVNLPGDPDAVKLVVA